MATVYSGINMTAFNRKQIQVAARNVNILHDNAITTPALLTAVKAK